MPYFICYFLIVLGKCAAIDLPPYSRVYYYFRRWQKRGRGEQINQVLRERLRQKLGKSLQATAAIVDSQKGYTTEKKGKFMAKGGGKAR